MSSKQKVESSMGNKDNSPVRPVGQTGGEAAGLLPTTYYILPRLKGAL